MAKSAAFFSYAFSAHADEQNTHFFHINELLMAKLSPKITSKNREIHHITFKHLHDSFGNENAHPLLYIGNQRGESRGVLWYFVEDCMRIINFKIWFIALTLVVWGVVFFTQSEATLFNVVLAFAIFAAIYYKQI